MTGIALVRGRTAVPRALIRHGWALGVWVLLGLLLAWYSTLIPRFGQFQVVSITKNSLPLIYLAMGQAIIVIAGGIDLSIGGLLLLSNVIAARFMADQPLGVALLLAVAILVGLALLNGLVGLVIHRSGMPDIVVTLATSYMWSGLALWILPSPGGGTAPEMRWLFTGSPAGIGGTWVTPGMMLALPVLAIYLVLRRTRLGLGLYAVGSHREAARLAGLDVARAKVAAYAFGGMLAGLAGLAMVALTGTGDPRFSVGANATLNSLAAVVLGGVALTGGAGSVIGAVAAAVILIMLNPILSAMGIDPNHAQVIQGALIAGVMMVGGLATILRERSS